MITTVIQSPSTRIIHGNPYWVNYTHSDNIRVEFYRDNNTLRVTVPYSLNDAHITLHSFGNTSTTIRFRVNSIDLDHDGITTGDELKYNTSPANPDTDNDGLKDGDEIKIGTDPLNNDTDEDGIPDGDEVLKYNTSPLNNDTDRDGLSDYVELFKTKTDPLNPDTDEDGIPDEEDSNPLEPNVPQNQNVESDKKGLVYLIVSVLIIVMASVVCFYTYRRKKRE